MLTVKINTKVLKIIIIRALVRDNRISMDAYVYKAFVFVSVSPGICIHNINNILNHLPVNSRNVCHSGVIKAHINTNEQIASR